MDKKEFISALIDYITNDLNVDFRLEPITVTKDNNTEMDGLQVFFNDDYKICPVFYIDEFYNDYISLDRSIEEVGNKFLKSIEMSKEQRFSLDKFDTFINNFDGLKDDIFIKLSDKSFAGALDSPYTLEGEFLATYHVSLQNFGVDNASVKINESLLNKWNVSLDDVKEIAFNNLKSKEGVFINIIEALLPPTITEGLPMNNYLDNDFDIDLEQLYVITFPDKEYGASLLLNAEFMDKIYNKIHKDFYICAISKHEAIIHPTLLNSEEEIISINQETIDETIEAKDVLSNKLYRYDSINKKVVLNSDYKITYFNSLASELIDIFETIDPYEARDSKLDNELELLESDIEEGNVDNIINQIKEYQEENTNEQLADLFGEDMPDRLERTLNHLINISADRKEVVTRGKSK